MLLETDPDPICAAKVDTPEERDEVYGDRAEELTASSPAAGSAASASAGARLGMAGATQLRGQARAADVRDASISTRWCLVGKGELRVDLPS